MILIKRYIIILLLIIAIFRITIITIIRKRKSRHKLILNIQEKEREYKKYLMQNKYIEELTNKANNEQLKYSLNELKTPINNNINITYYKLGQEFYRDLIIELKKAKKFIFIEFFTINEGKMWNTILEILKEKVKTNVEVRIIYDSMGCKKFLPKNYYKELENYGLKCIEFNKVNLKNISIINNRDHRKIIVIDGKIAYTGGVNISDEYINLISLYGEWKDNAIKLKGKAVSNFTAMFLTMWNGSINEDTCISQFIDVKNSSISEIYKSNKFKNINKNINLKNITLNNILIKNVPKKFYKSNLNRNRKNKNQSVMYNNKNSYIVAFSSSMIRKKLTTAETIYLDILKQAKKYVYISTPYLIIDRTMIDCIKETAKRGVKIKIVVPGIPDKKSVYAISSSYFEILINENVSIYKYLPGFMHSKIIVSDDKIAVVGSINLDYRSLYLHFEDGVYMENVKEIYDIKNDIIEAIEKSHRITKKEVKTNFIKKMFYALLRIIAPIL